MKLKFSNEKEQQETKVYAAALPLSSAVRTGLEPATPGVTGRYSNQLNYRTKDFCKEELICFAKDSLLFRLRVQSYCEILKSTNFSKKFFKKRKIFNLPLVHRVHPDRRVLQDYRRDCQDHRSDLREYFRDRRVYMMEG